MNDSDKVFETEFGRVSIESDPDSWMFLMYGRRKQDETEYAALEKLVEELGFCQCGDTERALEFILTCLRYVQEKDRLRDLPSGEEKDRKYEEIYGRRLEVFGSLGAAYFFHYWLDKEGYTEHGSSIMGSWLEDKGRLLGLKIIDVLGGEMKDE